MHKLKIMKPIIKYRGGKSKEIPFLIKYFPKNYKRYIEPFLGGGALYFHLSPQEAIVNDINTKLINFYLDIRERYELFNKQCELLSNSYHINRKEFEELKKLFPDKRVEDKNEDLYYHIRDMYNGKIKSDFIYSVLYYFINKTTYSGMVRYNALGEFNVPYGRYKNFTYDNITSEHISLLQRSTILNGDYEETFNMATTKDFMFLDPPYDCVFNDYGNKDGFSENEHRRLAENLKNINCPYLMVIGETPLTKELYKNNIIDSYGKKYSVNIRNRFKSEANHIIVSNY